MAMTLRLTDDESEALRRYASDHHQSMQEAAREAIRQLVHNERRALLIAHILDRDAELLHRLAE
jgi:predicted transcriptional regulator